VAVSQESIDGFVQTGRENRSVGSALTSAFEADRAFLAICAVYSAAAFLFTWMNGRHSSIIFGHYLGVSRGVAILFTLYLFLLTSLRSVVFGGPAGWRAALLQGWGQMVSRIVLGVLPVLVVMTIFMTAFTAYKNQITDIVPFYLDEKLAAFDAALHFGRHPWEWLQPLLGTPLATGVLEWVYATIWGLATFGMLYWQALRSGPDRTQYLITFALCWIVIGSVLATLMSSAGPPYYEYVANAENPYVPLFECLRRVSGVTGYSAIEYQDYLWAIHAKDVTASYTGISAMPSMHVSMATLVALAAWRMNHLLGWIAIFHLVLIQIASVHLGWHYATDGYLAIVLTVWIWRWSGRAAVPVPERSLRAPPR
jgi:hypothetical protein